MANISIESLIQSVRRLDPQLADALTAINSEVKRVAALVDPAPSVPKKVGFGSGATPADITSISYELTDSNVILEWIAPQNNFLFYEVREGSLWDTATRVTTTSNTSVFLDPTPIGDTEFLVKALTTDGVYSLNSISVIVTIPEISSFGVSSGSINNFVTLSWSVPVSTFRIDYFRIRRDGTTIAEQIKGTFFTIAESAGGTFVYGITAYDIAGNASAEMTVTLLVSDPIDFEFQDSLTSNLSGTIVNGKIEEGRLFVCIDLTTTYEHHFTNNGWASPQAQVTAGYTRWLSPFLTTGSYEEIFDFGIIFTNIIVNISWLLETIAGSFTFGIDAKVSDDNISYGSSNTSASFFVTSARYIKVKLTFTGGNDKALLAFSNFVCTLLVKREIDSGESDVLASDAAGTVISFNKAFKKVESITVTPLATAIRFWSYDFAGGVNPTTFKVKLWDSTGTRVDGHVSWKARGIL